MGRKAVTVTLEYQRVRKQAIITTSARVVAIQRVRVNPDSSSACCVSWNPLLLLPGAYYGSGTTILSCIAMLCYELGNADRHV